MLYLCPTPIGNLKDITLRTLEVLQSVDLIACENPRHSLKLLNHYDIHKPLITYNDHHGQEGKDEILKALGEGKSVGLISDAGMPVISDPGYIIVKEAIELGFKVSALPGPSALTAAVAMSGLASHHFSFFGFLPRQKKARQELLIQHKDLGHLAIFYESSQRILKTLKGIYPLWGNRQVVILREISKVYESHEQGELCQLIKDLEQRPIKGELVLLIGPGETEQKSTTIEEDLIEYVKKGLSKKQAISLIQQERKISRREVYQKALELQEKGLL